MTDTKILNTEYGSYRKEVYLFLLRRLQTPSVILDPMAGTAPLIPFIETNGHMAFFNDILPIHFFINKAKTLKIYHKYQEYGYDWYCEQLLHCMNSLEGKSSIISDKWIDDSILNGLIEAWQTAEQYDEDSAIFIKAIILLCVRPFASITKTMNPTWLKYGGISSSKSLLRIIQDNINRYAQYYQLNYGSTEITKRGECLFTKLDAADLHTSQKVDFILTSPDYCNRIDLTRLYGPENYFLSALGHTFPVKYLVSTPKIRDYTELAVDFKRLTGMSKSASQLLTKIKESPIADDSSYYLKYYTRFFSTLFNVLTRVSSNLSTTGRMYIVTQDNIHRGNLIQIDKIVGELFRASGWQSRVVMKWERRHHGLRNISKSHPLVVPKQLEKVMVLQR